MNHAEFRPLGKPSADAIATLATMFKYTGFFARCRACDRSLAMTQDGMMLYHHAGCPNFSEQHPWARLRAILNGAAEPGAAEEGAAHDAP